jgi:cell division protein FtsA
MVAVSKADRKISQEDVERVIQSARTVSMSSNEEIIEVFPREFVVDGKGGIKEVEGMQGQRLEIKASLVGCFSPYKGNLVQAVTNADVKIGDMYPSVLASAGAVLTPKQKELGVAVLDIGAGTTELAVFEEGNLIHLAVLPIGSSNITNDIAILLKTDIDTAELVKVKSGTCVFKGNDKREKIEVGDEGEVLVFSHRMLANIIGARMSEIFKEVQKELKTIGKQGNLPAGIVLTGGGANVPKIIELARKEFKLPSRIGRPLGFSNLDDSLNFASACGLVLKAAENGSGMVSKGGGIGGIFRKFAQTFIP